MMSARETQPIRVVVADDSAVFRSALIRLLAVLPEIEVIAEAANGQEALQIIEAMTPDLLILDIQMPVMDGLEVLHQLQKMEIRLQVVVLSAHGEGYHDHVLASGATAFVSKGDISRLIDTLTGLMKGGA